VGDLEVEPLRNVARLELRPFPDRLPHVRDLDLIALGDLVVVGLVREEERYDPEVDQVRGVDPLERLGDDRPDAEVARADRRVLARGALPVGEPPTITLWTPFALFSSDRLLNVGSTPSKTNSAYFAILERYFSRAPAGMMWSVVILSPTFRVTAPRIASGRGALSGGFPMFGPRRTETAALSAAGR